VNRPSILQFITLILLSFTLLLSGCSGSQPGSSPTTPSTDQPFSSPTEAIEDDGDVTPSLEIEGILEGLEGLDINEFFEKSYTALLLRNPEYLTESSLATIWGMRNDRLNNWTIEYLLDTQKLQSGILEILLNYDRSQLSEGERISLDVYHWYLDDLVRGHEFMYHNYPVHHFLMSYHDNLIRLFTELHPLTSIEDAEDYVARLSQVGNQIAQLMEGLLIREEMGIVPPDFILRMAIDWMSDYIGVGTSGSTSLDAKRLSIYTTFRDKLDGIEALSESEKDELEESALLAIETSFIPGYVELLSYMIDLAKVSSSDAGVWKFPDGDRFYKYILRHQTQTDMTPIEIHELGLTEVDRITAEMYEIFWGFDPACGIGWRLLRPDNAGVERQLRPRD
jgi:uncharacterized protein (DUF885 family)